LLRVKHTLWKLQARPVTAALFCRHAAVTPCGQTWKLAQSFSARRMRFGSGLSLFHCFHASLIFFSSNSVVYSVRPKTSGCAVSGTSRALNLLSSVPRRRALARRHAAAPASQTPHDEP